MSADSTNACPACYSREHGVPFAEVTQLNHLNKVTGHAEVAFKEYYEHYIDNGRMVFEYHGAQCDDCGYSIPEFTVSHSIPVPQQED